MQSVEEKMPAGKWHKANEIPELVAGRANASSSSEPVEPLNQPALYEATADAAIGHSRCATIARALCFRAASIVSEHLKQRGVPFSYRCAAAAHLAHLSIGGSLESEKAISQTRGSSVLFALFQIARSVCQGSARSA